MAWRPPLLCQRAPLKPQRRAPGLPGPATSGAGAIGGILGCRLKGALEQGFPPFKGFKLLLLEPGSRESSLILPSRVKFGSAKTFYFVLL